MSRVIKCLKQFKILCWKNFLLDKTHYILLPAQLITPVVMILIVFIIRGNIPISYGNETYYSNFSLSHKDIFYGGSQVNRKWVLAYCPNEERANAIMQGVMARTEGYLVVVKESMFDNETIMVSTIMSNSTYKNLVFAGVVFHLTNTSDGGLNVTYKLRFPAEQHWKSSDRSTWLTDSWYEAESRMAPRTNYFRGNIAKPGYLREGFLFLQRYIDDAIITALIRHTPLYDPRYDPIDNTQLKMFPYTNYKADEFIDIIRTYLPLFIIISFLINATIIAKEVTLEKENKLKESMKLMGLKVWINWCAWFAKFFLFSLVSVAVIIFFLHIPTSVGAVFNRSDPSVTFVFLTLYSTSVITFGFMMSAIFSKANVAAAVTAILYLLSYVPYYFMQIYYKELGMAAKIILSLFNNLVMSFGCMQFSRYEALGIGMTWSNMGNKEMAQDEMTLTYVMIMLVVDTVLYSILTWYFDALFPGEFGVPQPFYFPVMPWYWCGHQVQAPEDVGPEYGHMSEVFEKPEKNKRVGVRIRGLTKVFNRAQKPAVNSMNLDLYEGNITVFLGHNGAGKTTTMFMLTGFLKPSSGTVFINGHDISKNMDKVRQSLGLCPQHNILFETLTVEQHLYFFAQLKGCSSDELRSEIDQMLHMLNLQDKKKVMARALSGGMKRKLSIAIALIGGSRFVILDEPTSGMDPESRRQTWEILQQQRRGRTIILSTHFMDEADLLGDRIAVISNGEVECYGSPIFLKNRYGIGYHLTIVKGQSVSANDITALIMEHLDDAKFEGEMGAELTYLLPKADSKKLSKLFKAIESEKEALGIEGFGASVTTMEEVFLKVADMANKHKEQQSKLGTNFSQALRYIPSSSSLNEHKENPRKSYCFQSMPMRSSVFGGYISLLQSLFLKKILNSWRSGGTIAIQLILPLIFALLACSAIHSLPKRTDMPPLVLTYPPIISVASTPLYKTPYYISPGSSAAWIRCLKKVFPSHATERINISVAVNVTFSFNSTFQQSIVDQYLMDRAKRGLYKYQKHYLTAIEVLEDFDTVRGYFNDESYHAIAVTVNKLSNLRLCRVAQSSTRRNFTYQINTINHPLPWRAKNGLVGMSTINNLLLTAGILSNSVAFGMGLAMGTFILFIINERNSGAKHIQYLTGAGPLAFWGTALIWDLISYLVPTFMVVIVIAAFQTEGYFENIGLVFMLMVFFFWSMIFMIYCLSLVIAVASTGYIIVTVVNIFTGTVANLTISIMKYPTFNVVSAAMKLEWFLCAIFPNFCLNRGLFDLYYNYQSLKICNSLDEDFNLTQICQYSAQAKESNPCCPELCGDACLFRSENYLSVFSPGIGKPILFMSLQGLFFLFILYLAEFKVLQILFGNSVKRSLEPVTVTWMYPYVSSPKSPSMATNNTDICFFDSNYSSINDPALFPTIRPVEAEDDDVFEEKNKTLSMLTRTIEAGDHALVLRNVSKRYGNFLAVDKISLTVSKGECFGLLGVNGAGKTTTFKMMTGALEPSDGEIFIQGINVAKNTHAAQSLVGYCPQFDALIDQLTVQETLYMFANLRKLDPAAIPYVIDNFIDVLLLGDHRKKRAGNLSGGNKRKLCIGIALMGSPPIIFLDEPTTGMDPAARRNLWNTLTAVRESGKTIVLTSHSMEECEALCTRLAIMVNGRFKCLGSTQHLKTKFGGGHTVIIKQKPNKKRELLEYYARLIMNFMDRVFPGNRLKDRHEGILYFQTDDPNLTLARVFEILEKAKSAFEIEDYSVSQTTLEQLFINFAKTQRDRLH